MEKMLEDMRTRITLLERRLARAGGGGGGSVPQVQQATLDPPWFKARTTGAGQTTTNGGSSPTYTSVTTHGGWVQSGTNFTAPRDGEIYAFAQAGIEQTTATVGNNYVAITLNGSQVFQSAASDSDRGSSGNDYYRTGGLITVAAGDVIAMVVRTQISGAGYQADENRTFLHAYYVEGDFDVITSGAAYSPPTYARLTRGSRDYPNSSGWTEDAHNNHVTNGGIAIASDGSVVISREGLYLLDGRTNFAANSNGRRNLQVYVNGSGIPEAGILYLGFTGNTNSIGWSSTRYLSAGDVLRYGGWQNSGSTLVSNESGWNVTLLEDRSASTTTPTFDDTGWVTGGVIQIASANWVIQEQSFRRLNGHVDCRILLRRISAYLDFTTGGSFTVGTSFASAGWAPPFAINGRGYAGATPASPMNEGDIPAILLNTGDLAMYRGASSFGGVSTNNYLALTFSYSVA